MLCVTGLSEGKEAYSRVGGFGTVKSKNWPIENLELQEKEHLPVEAKMRQMGSTIQRLRDTRRSREGQIEKTQKQRHCLAANH